MSKVTTIRFNQKEERILDEMADKLGLTNRSATVKVSIPLANAYLEQFYSKFEEVIQHLKYTEIDTLITTMAVIAKQHKRERREENGL